MTASRRPTLSLQAGSPQPTRWAEPTAAHTQPHPDSRVFLIQEPSIPKHGGKMIDTTPLLWWGKVAVIVQRGASPSYNPPAALATVRARLAEFDPEKDYIAVAGGDSLGVLLVGATLVSLGHSFFHYLRFERTRLPDGTRDPSHGAYVPIRVPLVPGPDTIRAAL